MKNFLLILVILFSSNVFAQQSVESILERLESNMGQMQSLDTEFNQVKRLSVFKQDIKLNGKVYMQKPNMFSWQVDYPVKYKMVMDGKHFRQWSEDSGRVEKISLKGNPSFEVAIGQMQQWFSGQYIKMIDDYSISVLSENPVSLEFVPNENNGASKFIERVVIGFRTDEKYIESIDIFEKSGDSMSLFFFNSVINNDVSSDAWVLGA